LPQREASQEEGETEHLQRKARSSVSAYLSFSFKKTALAEAQHKLFYSVKPL
jgi:hypothetical protein